MRRLALVAEAADGTARAKELDAAERWLATLPCHGVRRYQRLAEVPLQETDVLWADGTAAPDPRLLPWLSAGGRLLATREGALLATAQAEARAHTMLDGMKSVHDKIDIRQPGASRPLRATYLANHARRVGQAHR